MLTWNDYTRYRVSPASPEHLTHSSVASLFGEIETIRPSAIQFRPIGKSVEGRRIVLVSIGTGPTTVLMWSQMHGDEPTHTAVLLDLLNYLQQSSDTDDASMILSQCTLHMIPLLNPDGAERWTRRNAQDIDINRDALRLQTPEGRALDGAVKELRPDFAFNLHNQNPRTAVGGTRNPAAVSLLVPSCDASEVEHSHMRRAKQVASCLVDAVSDRCPGMISRYDADFMPRAFGEAVQQTGAATLLVEAGGWETPDGATLEQLHFYALHAAIRAIADDSYENARTNVYEDLPRSDTHRRVDHLIAKATIQNGFGHAPFVADIGINVSRKRSAKAIESARGTIEFLGDLHVLGGKQRIVEDGLYCLPGAIAFCPDVRPASLASPQRMKDLLARGVTTAVGVVDLDDDHEVDQLEAIDPAIRLPINVGFLGICDHWSPHPSIDQLDRLLTGLARGVLAVTVAADHQDTLLDRSLAHFGVNAVREDDLPTADHLLSCTAEEVATGAKAAAELLGLVDRGTVQCGTVADLMLVKQRPLGKRERTLESADLRYVLINGSVVVDGTGPKDELAGRLLSVHCRLV